MAYFKTCSRCSAHLDPGEKCDCIDFQTLMELTLDERHELLIWWKNRKASRSQADQSTLQEAI